ncbi:hypothetical protein QUU97_22715, partial [Xanthomonas citri pv. citri]
TEFVVPAGARLPGGDGVTIRVVATVGGRSSSTSSESFVAPNQSPQVVIAGAPDGPVEQFDLVALTAVVDNPEVDDEVLVSWIHGDSPAATSPGTTSQVATLHDFEFATRDLPIGTTTISVVVTDSAGN